MIRDELDPAADAIVKAAKEGGMRTSRAFILGAVTGAVVTWIWGRQIADFVRDRTRGVRAKAAAGIQALETNTDKVLDRGAKSLRRAEEALEDTKEQVNEVLRAGRQAIRP